MVTCTICNKEFESFKELSKHLIKEHEFNAEELYKYYNYSFETGGATCPVCGKEFVMSKLQIKGFKKNPNKSIGCCISCSKSIIMLTHGSPLADPKVQQKIRNTVKEKYGVDHISRSKDFNKKMNEAMKEKYGVENAAHIKGVKEKKKLTNLKKYGAEYPLGSKEVRDKIKKTNKKKYGVENPFQSEEIKEKIKKTNKKKYGVEYPTQSTGVQEKTKRTNQKKYGVEYPVLAKEVQEKIKKTNNEKYGVDFPLQSQEVKDKIEDTITNKYGVKNVFQSEEIKEKIKKTNKEKYGVECTLFAEEIKEKIKKTNKERYGVEYFCQHKKCYEATHNRISKVNRRFQEFLNENNIESELEFIIENSGYDLKVGNTLIEIDPWFTHNTTIAPTFGKKVGKIRPSNYHAEKTNFAKEHGYNCIHIFDWDDPNKIVNLLQPKERIYARECEVKEIDKKVAKEFLESYHLQGSTRGVKFACGLFYKGELVEVMTFGKPRYNKNYEYELLRLCTKPTVSVIGGASKILNFFEEQVKPSSLISYCDLSKFNGEVYAKLGFELKEQTAPTKHWYHPKTKKHITDNLLRQRGFDQLHKTNFGKGTSNEELMKEYGYVEIYDCGQLVFVKEFKNY